MMRNAKKLLWGRRSEEGGSLVEMALVSALVYMPMLFGIFEVSYGLFAYNFVCNASRQATRYAVVRGLPSCIISTSFVDCGLGPSGSQNPTNTSGGSTTLQNYVRSLGSVGIDRSRVTVTANWLSSSISSAAGGTSTTTWVACPSGGDSAGNLQCNSPGDAVQVVVTYNFPLPFWNRQSIVVKSTSMMVINE
jgi:TadE-like protein